MITIKQVEKDERWAIIITKKFIYNHPIVASFTSTIILMFILAALGIVMILAAAGGGYAEKNMNDRYTAGEITAQEYHSFTIALDFAAWCYGFINALVGFIVGLYILILSYGAFKYYLEYNRDNL